MECRRLPKVAKVSAQLGEGRNGARGRSEASPPLQRLGGVQPALITNGILRRPACLLSNLSHGLIGGRG
jgi:hypothetical protein